LFIENHAFVIICDVSNAFAKQKNSLNAIFIFFKN